MSAKLRTATVGLIVCSVAAASASAAPLAEKVGVRRGICVLLADVGAKSALALARGTELTLYVQLADDADVQAACAAADKAGLYGTRIYVAKGTARRIHLADNLADAVVAPAGAPEAEVLRVLRPMGKGFIGEKLLTKPFPAGVDDWSHHYHGPDNNPQSRDKLARAPYRTQFIVEPRYGPCPQATVAAGGRLFAAFGHVAWHEREEPWLNTLLAVNGFNGTVLWKRALKAGIMVDRSTMIATVDTLYFGDDESCKLIDAATGKVTGEIKPPAGAAGGSQWKWMALDPAAKAPSGGGVLYALVGKVEPVDPVARWRRKGHGWPWGQISKGYNTGRYPWGFAVTLLAFDAKTGKLLWRHHEEEAIDSRSLCMAGGRIYFCSFGKYLVALDAADGKDLWRRTRQKDPELFEKIGPYRPGHGYIGGWKSTAYLKCTDEALYFVGPQVNWLTAVSAKDGAFLWKYPKKDLHVVLRDDAVYTIGAQNSRDQHTKKLDPLTGKELAGYVVHRRACTRTTGGPDGIYFRAHGGTTRLDLATGKCQYISAMRPSCHVGVVIASGHLYWVPWTCDCSLQVFGIISLAPAGGFKLPAKVDAARLESGGGGPLGALGVAATDWPTYRADNARTAASKAAVPQKVKLLWTYSPKGKVQPTAPVAAHGLVYVAGTDGVVYAFLAENGREKWRAYTGGAVRYPPTIAAGRALVGSGDGWAYCFDDTTGRRLWRFRAAPVERKINVYGRLLSTWPVAAGVLVEDGVAYLAAGINDYDGTCVYALEAVTGSLKWANTTAGHLDAFSRRGVAVQGDMLLHAGKLYLAGGNAASPGVFNIANGKCLTRPPAGNGARAPRGRELRLDNGRVRISGQPFYSNLANPVYDRGVRWTTPIVTTKNARLTYYRAKQGDRPVWMLKAEALADGRTLWQRSLPARPVRWGVAVDAAGRVVVSLRDGRVLCFGKG